MENGKRVFGKDIVLCPLNSSRGEVWTAFNEMEAGAKSNTLCYLVSQFKKSMDFTQKKPRTQQDYSGDLERIINTRTASGQSFGSFDARTIKTHTVQRYVEERSRTAGVRANREKAALSSCLGWAARNGYIPSNPCIGVKGIKETPRDRYVTDEEYQALYDAAPSNLKVAMELAYLCRMRKIETVELKWQAVDDTHVLVKRKKGSKTQLVERGERLNKALDLAKSLRKNVVCHNVLLNNRGLALTGSAITTAWGKAFKKAFPQGMEKPFTFHDLKAKGVSDFQGDKQAATGDYSPRMVRTYDRQIETIAATR
jgi:integrase